MANGKNGKKKTRKKIIWIAIGGIILLLILKSVVCGKRDPGIMVQSEKAARRDITQLVSATGIINPAYQVAITPEVTGEIVELPVKEGERVRKNQLLIRIKPDSYTAQRDRARANLESSQATLAMKKVEMDFIAANYRRTQELFRSGYANQQELDKMKADLDSSRAQLEAQQGYVQQAQAALKESGESLNKTAIYSPMDGTVSKLNVELGERVLGSGFSQGTDLMTVADLGKMEAIVDVDENDVVLVSIGDTAKIELDAFKNITYNGKVTQIANSAKTTGMGTQEEVVNFAIKIALSDFNPQVRPGMSCNADIEVETKDNVLAVPIQSVTARSEEAAAAATPDSSRELIVGKTSRKKQAKPKEVVFVLDKGTVAMKEVKIGISDNEFIEVTSGLKEGEEVVSGPYRAISSELQDKSKVQTAPKGKAGKGKKN
ncbi:MAG: efflux RND transporter periplasmic adaptor subunit [Acidobacteria bacterium]|jgi:HlyD family secretion protein|nr:efflux RND transporter periplasmic adaptor subunit [Acidobacteriota bacterium]